MGLSFGIGYSSDGREARERLKGKRLENKKLFDTWLSEKREAGESVSLEDLEQKKFELTNGDSLYSNMIGNQAVLKDKTLRHNQVVGDKIVAEATDNIKNLSEQKKLYASEMSTKDKDFEAYKERVSMLFGNGDKAKGALAMANSGIDEEWWEKESQKLYETKATEVMGTLNWANVQEKKDIKKIFPHLNSEIITILERNFEGQERKIRAEQISKAISSVTNLTDVTGYLAFDANQLKEEVVAIFQANGIANPTNEEILNATNLMLKRVENARKMKLGEFHNKFAKEFYGGKFLNDWIEKSSDVMPSNDELEGALMEALHSAGFPAWAKSIEGYNAETIMKDGQWAGWLDDALGKNWSTDLRRAMYARTWQENDQEQEAAMKATVDLLAKDSFTGLANQAENKERYGKVFKAGTDKKPIDGIGMPALGELANGYYIPRHQREQVVDFLHKLFKENSDMSSVKAVDATVAQFQLQSVIDWKQSEISKRGAYDEGAVLPPNTDFQDYANGAAVSIKTSIIDEAVKTIQDLPSRDKRGDLWMHNSAYQSIKDTTIEALNKQKKQIIKHIAGQSQYAFINQNNPFDLTLGDEVIKVTSMEEAKEKLINYIDQQIEYVNTEFPKLTPEGKYKPIDFSNPEAGGMPTSKQLELNNEAKALKWNVGNEATSIIVKGEGGGKGLVPNPEIWDVSKGEIRNEWVYGSGAGSNNRNRGVLIAIALDIMNQTDDVEKQKKLFRNLIMFGLEDDDGQVAIDDDTFTYMRNNGADFRSYSRNKIKDTALGFGIGYGGKTFLERLFDRAISEAKAFEEETR